MTLIVLLILAGVSLSAVFSEKGIFSRAEKAGNKYNEAKAREVLETVLLADGQYEKHTNPKYNQDDFLNELITKEIEGAEIKGDVAILDGWAFLLDRSVPKIGDPLGRADGLIFPTVEVSKVELAKDYRSASFTVTAIEETNGINKIEIWLNGEKIKDLDKEYNNIKEEIEQEFTVNKNGVYTVKVYGKLMASATVEVTGIVPAVEFTPNGNKDWKKEHQTKITVKTSETITSMKYLWTTSGTNEPEVSDFNNAEPCTNNSIVIGGNGTMTGTYYLWVLLTTQTGEIQKTNICGSEGFNFDNEGPTVKLESIPVSETSFTLTATASDNKSGVARYEFYVDGERKEPTTITEGTATYTWSGTEMTDNKECYVIVTDKAANESRSNLIQAKTKLYTWEKWSLNVTKVYKEKRTLIKNNYSIGRGDNYIEIGFRYTFNERTGCFCITETANRRKNAINSWFSPTYIGKFDSIYFYDERSYSSCNQEYIFKQYRINSELANSIYSKNSFITNITSKNPSEYPTNDHDDNYWYIYKDIQ